MGSALGTLACDSFGSTHTTWGKLGGNQFLPEETLDGT